MDFRGVSLSDGIGVFGIISSIVLLVLDKAGKLRGGWLVGLLVATGAMTLFLAIGNSWVLDAPVRWRIWRGMLMLSVVAFIWSGLAIWISGGPSETESTGAAPPTDSNTPPNPTEGGSPGPGAALGITGAVSAVVTPSTPKRGAMAGVFATSGRGEYEVDILGVSPEELLFKPPNVVVEKSKLPVDFVIDGHKLSIRKFTDKGFVIFDNGWRDISITVSPIKAAGSSQLVRSTPHNSPQLESKPQENTRPDSIHKGGTAKSVEIEQRGVGNGAVGGSITAGPCTNVQIGGSGNLATTNCGQLPLELTHSIRLVIPPDKGLFQFTPEECLVKSQIRIVPNQKVPPPIQVLLEFDNPVTKIAATVENVTTLMSGGTNRTGVHAIASVGSPGIGPSNPLLVEVCSALPVKLIAPPRVD